MCIYCAGSFPALGFSLQRAGAQGGSCGRIMASLSQPLLEDGQVSPTWRVREHWGHRTIRQASQGWLKGEGAGALHPCRPFIWGKIREGAGESVYHIEPGQRASGKFIEWSGESGVRCLSVYGHGALGSPFSSRVHPPLARLLHHLPFTEFFSPF